MADGEPSYIDYEAFLDPDFSPASFANTLVTSTNNATDTPLDLSTPLSRVLFDLQEIDTHIHALTTRSALPLLSHTQSQTAAADRILKESETQIASVTQGYERLQKEVIQKWEAANEARIAAENSLATVRLARAAARCLTLGRQLESQVSEITGRGPTGPTLSAGPDGATSPSTGKEGFRALERAAYTILSLREMFSAAAEGEEGYGLDRVKVIRTLRGEFVIPAENMIKSRAQQAINKFSLSSNSSSAGQSSVTSGYKQARDARARLATAATTLYLLSPPPKARITAADYKPELLLSTLQGFMHTAIMTSVNNLSRALTQLPVMDRTLADISARCQDIVALEYIITSFLLLAVSRLVSQPARPGNRQPGGVSARSLRSNRDRLRVEIKECVLRASQVSATSLPAEKGRSGTETVVVGNWEREAAVMVSSIVGPLGR
ncbi:hypothetical protein N7535_000888 [Penicillium sp. DV-2018c]|nr:hypothetical protein N7535_000888 [Penicillium sp. DV-2018c]